jgi:glycosyltransferase involved in cell wall biosynthesis
VLFTQVSRLAELKGHRFVLEAARRVRDRRAHFCFVGDGPWGAKIRRAVRAHEHGDRFRLTGLLPPRQIPAVMHASDALLHCSLREGLARALPQAMLAARPAVSFDVDGAAEVVDETTGVLLEAADVAGLAAAIDRLAGDAALRTRLGEAGRRRCRERFSAERMVEEIFRVYRGLLEGRGLPPDGPAGENVRP